MTLIRCITLFILVTIGYYILVVAHGTLHSDLIDPSVMKSAKSLSALNFNVNIDKFALETMTVISIGVIAPPL
jgi:hypothetical protein